MNLFTFIADGERKAGVAREEAEISLLKVFSIDEEKAARLLDGQSVFVREKIDALTCDHYQALFDRCGLTYRVIDFNPDIDPVDALFGVSEQSASFSHARGNAPGKKPVNDSATQAHASQLKASQVKTCPKCQSEDIDSEKCNACGIYFAKFKRIQKPEHANTQQIATTRVATDSYEDETKINFRSGSWLKFGALIIVAAYIANTYLEKMSAGSIVKLDLGYFPLLLGHLVLLRGCILYAAEKGYSSFIGLLGLLGLAGFSILVLLPNQRTGDSNIGLKQLTVTLVAIFMYGHWAYGYFATGALMTELKTQVDILSEGRSEYPATSFDSESEVYLRETNELVAFFNQNVAYIEENGLSSRNKENVFGLCFLALAQYQTWLNYQTYLHRTHDKPLPDFLVEKNLRKNTKVIYDFIHNNPGVSNDTDFKVAMNFWLHGVDLSGKTPQYWLEIRQQYNKLHGLMFRTKNGFVKKMKREKNLMPSDVDLRTLNMPSVNKINVVYEKDTLTYSAPFGPLRNNPVVVALYLEPYSGKWVNYRDQYYYDAHIRKAVISSNIEAKEVIASFVLLGDYF